MPLRTAASFGPEKVAAVAAARTELEGKREFCGFMSNSCFKVMYEGDAFIRTLFFDMLSTQHKPCHGLGGCRRTPGKSCDHSTFGTELPKDWDINTDVAAECYRDYKFVITMDNQREMGYMTEKVFNALLAPSVPIYFGAPDVHQYLNTQALVLCNISDAKIAKMRKYWVDNNIRGKAKKGLFTEADGMRYLIEELRLGEDLQPCIDQVIQLDQSDDMYTDMLSRHALPSSYNNSIYNTHYDGGVITQGFLDVLKALDSSVLDGQSSMTSHLHSQNDNLVSKGDGMSEETLSVNSQLQERNSYKETNSNSEAFLSDEELKKVLQENAEEEKLDILLNLDQGSEQQVLSSQLHTNANEMSIVSGIDEKLLNTPKASVYGQKTTRTESQKKHPIQKFGSYRGKMSVSMTNRKKSVRPSNSDFGEEV
eukprot:CAMPEP_0196576610 /NCGR_PEP_ID=MMETSP1081-20130531/5823_1 /TAXON_ID=36882 /ORGANISM="Pyramimonas amylifera, Strain CCMP720" /LENGTH=423 /DNA_ID=CAMNT_0041895261 /DNA_START=339 /DNA_END=1610 /DNA_ORIENTATION=-